MKHFLYLVLAAGLFTSLQAQVDTSKSKFWMMTYFINGQDNTGARLAFSSDSTGVRWQKYNNEAAILKPIQVTGANDTRMRDPMIAYDSTNKRFNMIWTVSWTGKVIGWDTSSYLKDGTWGPQVGLPVSNSINNSSFSWAPEIFWDDIQSKWMLYWSVAVSGTNTRMYYSMVDGSDFRSFSEPKELINTGFDLIDGSIIKVGPGDYQMFFKDERTGYKYIRRASGATTPQGPYTTISEVVANASTEGPTIYRAGGHYRLIVDHYSNQGLGVCSAADINTPASPWQESWCIFGTGTSRFVGSHCNVIEVPKMLVKWMLYNDSTWVRYVKGEIVKAEAYRPVQASGAYRYSTAATTVDLLGKLVTGDRLQQGAAIGTKGKNASGCYLRVQEGREQQPEVKVVPGN
ncbi:MAG: family 43 glycosylhydrolase [Chitinispirillaceae bacterium]|nr:family 43 glycosylhydrolase [Chitinispirillaceae bacterium]